MIFETATPTYLHTKFYLARTEMIQPVELVLYPDGFRQTIYHISDNALTQTANIDEVLDTFQSVSKVVFQKEDTKVLSTNPKQMMPGKFMHTRPYTLMAIPMTESFGIVYKPNSN